MALFYADASALVKLVRDEPESHALRAFLAESDIVSSELVLTEVPRAIRRAAADDVRLAWTFSSTAPARPSMGLPCSRWIARCSWQRERSPNPRFVRSMR